MAAPSSNSAIRKALRQFEDGLQTFCGQLATETAELRRNVENQPCTGAYYRNVLEDLQQRADAVGQELQALSALSLDAVSIEELVGHSVALYCQNYEQIQKLEATLAQYGYRDLYAPLPPENPLDMLELTRGQRHQQPQHLDMEAEGEEYADGEEAAAASHDGEEPLAADGSSEGEEPALGEVTNRLAGARLAADCDASPPARGAAGGAPPPRTALKAMAPMTAAKALMRPADTPSSLASPEALSPSMRELLGKYAASSGGGLSMHPLSSAPASGTPRLGSGSAGPRGATPSYLSPAFQLAAMEQEVQMAHASAAAAQQGSGATPPPAAPGWQADDAMYNALTATAKKLADKPSFMEAYRQKFPHIMASTERLLQTVEKQRRPAAAAAVAQEEAAAGPVAALALAAQAAAGGGQQGRRHVADEESTLDLMAQVLISRRPLADEHTAELGMAAAAGSPPQASAAADAALDEEQHEQPAPTTAALLSRAMGSGAAAAGSSECHPISSLRADDPPSTAAGSATAAAAAGVPQSAPRSERSKPQLEAAIAAALGRSTSAAPTPAAQSVPSSVVPAPAVPSATPAPAAAAPRPPALPASVARAPPPPPAAPAAAAGPSGTAAASVAVPPLRLVGEGEYAELPTFIRSQLPLDALNTTLQRLHAVATERSSGFTMADVESAGLGAKCKVVVNSLVKLGRAQLKVAAQGTLYLLV